MGDDFAGAAMTGADRMAASGGASRARFARAPFVVIWEVTRACDLACVHCRALALPAREAGELSTAEGMRLIEQVRGLGRPIFVLTGGDPLKRDDIFDLIAGAAEAGLPVHLSPSGTPLLTHAALLRGRDAGLKGVSISLDGSHADMHDRFRGVAGSFRCSVEQAGAAAALGLKLQINTTLASHNVGDLPAIADLVGALEARRWTIFLLVPTGRADAARQVDAATCERVFAWLADLAADAPFRIKTTEAPHYRRLVLQRSASAGARGGGRFVPGMNDGSGFVFISSKGEIQPSGFLPISAGNVRRDRLADVYRDHPLFTALRDPERLEGRCGRCAFRGVCGGSRARAWATGGNYLGEDPACAYQPPAMADNAEGRIA